MGDFKNTVLNALPLDAIRRLHVSPVNFEVGHALEVPGMPILHLYFVEDGMASLTPTFRDGSQVEVGMFGYESVIGVSALMGTKQSLNRVYTQIAGNGFRCSIAHAVAEFQRGDIFQTLALRYVQAQLIQAMQSGGCNAKHEAEQRLARWLLLCADRVHRNDFAISQEFLAHMLGTRRTTVTMAALSLKDANIISYKRGRLSILDPAALLKRSCECYAVIKDHLDSYEQFDSGIVA